MPALQEYQDDAVVLYDLSRPDAPRRAARVLLAATDHPGPVIARLTQGLL